MSLAFFERIAEEKIREAISRGDLDHLPGAGKPIPNEDTLAWVPAELRMAYRVMKNAGFVPEEIRLRREIEDLVREIEGHEEPSRQYHDGLNRLHFLMDRLGETRGGNLAIQDIYYRQLAEKLGNRRRNAP